MSKEVIPIDVIHFRNDGSTFPIDKTELAAGLSSGHMLVTSAVLINRQGSERVNS